MRNEVKALVVSQVFFYLLAAFISWDTFWFTNLGEYSMDVRGSLAVIWAFSTLVSWLVTYTVMDDTL